jgi:hypothetical protein
MTRLVPLVAAAHPDDEMLRYSVAASGGHEEAGLRLYLDKGRQIAECVLALGDLAFPEAGSGALLDFASGFGRSTRFLVTALPAKCVTVSDVQRAGLAYQAATFGVRTLDSTLDPELFRPEASFDLVFAASFFSHVPPARFAPWLRRLAALCRDDGLVAFSTLPVSGDQMALGGQVVHVPESESAVLTPEDYGTTWVSDRFVSDALAEARRAGDRLEVVRRGLCARQDLWVLRRGRAAVASLAGLPRHPAGQVDRVASEERDLVVEGWCEDPAEEGSGLAEVVLERSGAPPERVGYPIATRRARFRFTLDRRRVGLDDLIEIVARTVKGPSSLLAAGTLRPFVS